jgi:hypothetical protein
MNVAIAPHPILVTPAEIQAALHAAAVLPGAEERKRERADAGLIEIEDTYSISFDTFILSREDGTQTPAIRILSAGTNLVLTTEEALKEVENHEGEIVIRLTNTLSESTLKNDPHDIELAQDVLKEELIELQRVIRVAQTRAAKVSLLQNQTRTKQR